MKMNVMDWIAMILLVIGGLNWGLYGAFEFDLVATIFGDLSVVSKIVYVLVGLSALYVLVTLPAKGKSGSSSMPSMPQQ
ncbi:MAG: DUF378 domain-containing protein [Candidatus Nomurabacteria bacterium]|nr:MAG: DUF378 domain-containing protein [Candidatus Nomurabacteria bacterium]